MACFLSLKTRWKIIRLYETIWLPGTWGMMKSQWFLTVSLGCPGLSHPCPSTALTPALKPPACSPRTFPQDPRATGHISATVCLLKQKSDSTLPPPGVPLSPGPSTACPATLLPHFLHLPGPKPPCLPCPLTLPLTVTPPPQPPLPCQALLSVVPQPRTLPSKIPLGLLHSPPCSNTLSKGAHNPLLHAPSPAVHPFSSKLLTFLRYCSFTYLSPQTWM